MATIVIHDVPDYLVRGLEEMATERGLSLEAYLLEVLIALAKAGPNPSFTIGEIVDRHFATM